MAIIYAEFSAKISNVVVPRSQHENIDLVSEDDMYLNAPEAISKPVRVFVLAYF